LARMLPLGEADAVGQPLRTPPEAGKERAWAGKWTLWPILPGAAMVGGVLYYGHWRLGQEVFPEYEQMFQQHPPAETSSDTHRQARILLVQGSIDTQIKDDPQKQTLIMEQYIRLSQTGVAQFGRNDQAGLDLLVWPETMFRTPWVTVEEPPAVPEDWPGRPEEFRRYVQDSVRGRWRSGPARSARRFCWESTACTSARMEYNFSILLFLWMSRAGCWTDTTRCIRSFSANMCRWQNGFGFCRN